MTAAALARCRCFGLVAAAILLAGAAPPARRELGLADALSLRLPAVADSLGLSQKQRERVRALTREYGSAFDSLLREYPRGDQDTEGIHLRSRARDRLSAQTRRVTADLLAVLEPKQRAALERRGPASFSPAAPAGAVEPARSEPSVFDRLGLTQRQWSDVVAHARRPRPFAIDLNGEPSEKDRRDLAERAVAWFAQRDRATREVLTEEQRLIADEWSKGQRGPTFYLLTGYGVRDQPRERQVERLRPAAGRGPSLEVEGCFAVLSGGKGRPRVLAHPPDRLVNAHAFSHTGKLVATVASTFMDRSGPESVLRIWEVGSGRLLAEFPSRRVFTRVGFVDDRVLVVSTDVLNDK